MTHRSRRLAIYIFTAIAVVPLVSACLLSPKSRAAAAEARIAHAVDVLKMRTDADSLAAAGLLTLQKHPDQSLVLITRATIAAPERADLLWLHISMCRPGTSCDPVPLELRLRTLDAQNAAGWLGDLARTDPSTDDKPLIPPLGAISRSKRLDIYWTSLIAALGRATINTRAMSANEAVSAVIGLLAAQTIPAYHAVADACKGTRLSNPEVLEVCRGVANSLMNGDAYITEMVGVGIAQRSWPENSQEWKAAAQLRRTYDYRAKDMNRTGPWRIAHMDEYLSLCSKNRREQDVYKAEMIARGKSPFPPAT